MTIPLPKAFPEDKDLVFCVVGARTADAVYPDRPDADDVTLQVLAFTSLGCKGRCLGLLHLNTSISPLPRTRRGSRVFPHGFLRQLVDCCNLELPYDGVEETVLRLHRLAFRAKLRRCPNGRHVPDIKSMRVYNKQVVWNKVFKDAWRAGLPVAGGTDLVGLKCAAREEIKAYIGDIREQITLSPWRLLQMLCDGPVLLIDMENEQMLASPSSQSRGVRPIDPLFVEDGKHKSDGQSLERSGRAAAISTLIALMLNIDRELPFYRTTLFTADDILDNDPYRQRVRTIRSWFGSDADNFILKGRPGRKASRSGRLNPNCKFIVVADDRIRQVLSEQKSFDAWGINSNR